MSKLYIILSLICISVIGAIRNNIQCSKLQRDIEFAMEYLSNLNKYHKSNGNDIDTYSWLIYNSVMMQTNMGWLGVMDYRPPFAGYMMRNYQVIVNLLSELKQAFESDRMMTVFSMANQYYSLMSETLVRYLGVIENNKKSIADKMKNPVINFRDGIQVIVSSPLYLLKWFGLGGNSFINNKATRGVIRLISSLVAFISFISAIVSLFVGWNDFIEIIIKLTARIR